MDFSGNLLLFFPLQTWKLKLMISHIAAKLSMEEISVLFKSPLEAFRAG